MIAAVTGVMFPAMSERPGIITVFAVAIAATVFPAFRKAARVVEAAEMEAVIAAIAVAATAVTAEAAATVATVATAEAVIVIVAVKKGRCRSFDLHSNEGDTL